LLGIDVFLLLRDVCIAAVMSSSATLSSVVDVFDNFRTDVERYFGAESIPGRARSLLEASP